MTTDVRTLNVLLHARPVGVLTRLPGDRTLFSFNDRYLENPNAPTLSLSFKTAMGEPVTATRPTQTRVPPFFSNLLPEGPLRQYLANRAGISSRREFFLLWVLGRDLPGAITIEPADGEAWPEPADHGGTAIESGPEPALRFSLAGVQLKFSAIMEATGGLTFPAHGAGGSWIVKLPSARFEGVPENEYAMMTLARDVGIDVPEVHLVAADQIAGMPEGMATIKGPALAVRRFDRTDNGKIHAEDFAQVFGVYPERKYGRASYRNIAEVLWTETGARGIAEFIRRLVFNTLIGNADMHLKNWSLVYPNGRDAALSPGYDFVSTIAFLPDDSMALKYARSRKMLDFSYEELAALAAKARLPEKLVVDTARDTVECFKHIWNQRRLDLPLRREVIRIIERHMRSVPLYQTSR